MIVAIHGQANRNFNDYVVRYETILRHNGIASCRVDAGDADFLDRLRACDAFVFRWGQTHDVERQMAHAVIPVAERVLRKPCFPNWTTCAHFDDKIAQYYLLSAAGWPFEKCWVFWNEQDALKWCREANMPVVAKLYGGAGSRNVMLLRSREAATAHVRRMFRSGVEHDSMDVMDGVNGPGLIRRAARRGRDLVRMMAGRSPVSHHWTAHRHYVLFQRYLPGNDFDVRIVTIGRRAFGYRRFRRPRDFRASGSGLKDLNPRNIDLRCVRLALDISQTQGFQSMAYDFFYNEEGMPRILEISYTVPELAVVNLPGYWDAALNWHDGHYWPQYFHLTDLLGREDLRQPDMPFPRKWDTLPDGQRLHPGLSTEKP